MPISVNRGNPAVLAEPGSDFSKAIRELAKADPAARRRLPRQGKRRSFSLARSWTMGLHDRLSRQGENGAAALAVVAERRRGGPRRRRERTRTPS